MERTGKVTICRSSEELRKGLKEIKGRLILVTDANVKKLYPRLFEKIETIIVPHGEKNKSMQTVLKVYKRLLELDADRSTFIVGVGGGTVSDLTGFVASTYMRGLRFGFIPTTLLSQADAAIGGKNAVNMFGYRNLVGTIHQPELIFINMKFLSTLPKKEVHSGYVEIIKHALIKDYGLFEFMEENSTKLLSLDEVYVAKAICESIRIKTGIVVDDEYEKDTRRLLNLGHTLGHAIESVYGGKISHGEAVAMGIIFSAGVSKSLGKINDAAFQRIKRILNMYGLNTDGLLCKGRAKKLYDAIMKDKKKDAEGIYFVMLEDIGKGVIQKMDVKDIKRFLNDL